MRVYHTETQEDFNALMEELEREGCIWGNDNVLTELKHKWTIWRKDTVIIVKKGALAILPKSCVTNDKLIVKFTKSNNIKSKVPVVPQFVADSYEGCGFKTKFTEAEIKEMGERYWQFAVTVEEVTG